jgi:ABC-type multidrug transport system ATPase subunit
MSLRVVSVILSSFDFDFTDPFLGSGLDAYNAFNVVESLTSLARDYNRTVVFTIHQPRSNIVALFDQLVLLAQGKLVYSGEMSQCQEYFASIGRPCPPGFNIADYLSMCEIPI